MDHYQHLLPLLAPVIADAWKDVARIEAPKLINKNRPMIRKAATALALVHPYALDYLKQAPILIVATGLHTKRRASTERAVLKEWEWNVRRGLPLRGLMAQYNVHYQMRALHGHVVHVGQAWAPRVMQSLRVPESAMAQAIPKNRTRQGRWLACCASFYQRMLSKVPGGTVAPAVMFAGGRRGEQVTWSGLAHPHCRAVWATLAMGHGPAIPVSVAYELADFVWAMGQNFNERWTLAQAMERSAEWHQAQTALRGGLLIMDDAGPVPAAAYRWVDSRPFTGDWQAPLGDYSPFPDEWMLPGRVLPPIRVVALKSARDLADEGRAMNHCVASYWEQVQSGRSRIFSVRLDMPMLSDDIHPFRAIAPNGRLATFELIHVPHIERDPSQTTWAFNQVQGPRPEPDYKVPPAQVPWASAVIKAYTKGVLGYEAQKRHFQIDWNLGAWTAWTRSSFINPTNVT